MTFAELLARASAGYPDDLPALFLNPRTGRPRRTAPDVGDLLARFVFLELFETFDPDASNDAQLDEAIDQMRVARDELDSVVLALTRRDDQFVCCTQCLGFFRQEAPLLRGETRCADCLAADATGRATPQRRPPRRRSRRGR